MKVILIGAGSRGKIYTDLMTDDRFEVVTVNGRNIQIKRG